jgi:hypothetical protein
MKTSAVRPKNASARRSSCLPIAPPQRQWGPISCGCGLRQSPMSWSTPCAAIALHDTQFADASADTIYQAAQARGPPAHQCATFFLAITSSCPNQDEFEATYLALKRVELRLNQIGLNPLRMRFARGRTRASRSTTFVNAVCVHLARRFLQPDAGRPERVAPLIVAGVENLHDC